MPRKRHTAEEIIHKLREAEIALAKGLTTGDRARKKKDSYVFTVDMWPA